MAAGATEVAVFAARRRRSRARTSIARSPRASRASGRSCRRHGGPKSTFAATFLRARLSVRRRCRCRTGSPRYRSALYAMGCYEISLGDTIGVGTPGRDAANDRGGRAARAYRAARGALPRHLWPGAGEHLRVARARRRGVRHVRWPVSAAVPMRRARRATSRRKTSCTCCTASAIETGVDLDALIDAGAFICKALLRQTNSRVARAIAAKRAT